MTSSRDTVTQLFLRLREGDETALEHLMPLLYDELHDLAARQLRDERNHHTLNATALVNEAYLRLVEQRELKAGDRAQFLAIASVTMRRVLVDYARAKKRLKRGGGVRPTPLDDVLPYFSEDEAGELIALDEALDRLKVMNPRGSDVVQYRFFSGLTLEETAEVLCVSVKTVQRAWIAARAWLRKEVRLTISR